MRKLYANTILLLSVLAATLCLVEVVLRFLDYPQVALSGWPESAFPGADLQDRQPGRTNQLGYSGRDIVYNKDDFVVVLVGDSQAVSCGGPCASHPRPEVVLERMLKTLVPHARVFTVAASGYGQDQQLIGLQRYFKHFRADLVLHWETLTNDIWNNLFPTHWPGHKDGTPKPTYKLVDEVAVGPHEELGQPVHAFKLYALFANVAKLSRDRTWEATLQEAFRPLERPEAEGAHVVYVNHPENLVNEKSHRSVFLTPASPRFEYGLKLSRALILELEQIAVQHDARFYAFQEDRLPGETVKYGEDLFYFQQNGLYYPASVNQMRTNRTILNEGIPFSPVPIRLKNYTINRQNTHLNPRANRQVLGDLVAILAGKGYLPAANGTPANQ